MVKLDERMKLEAKIIDMEDRMIWLTPLPALC